MAGRLVDMEMQTLGETLVERLLNLDIKTSEVEDSKVMNTLNDTLVNKAIDTLRDSQASKIKNLYYSKHTCNKEGKWSV